MELCRCFGRRQQIGSGDGSGPNLEVHQWGLNWTNLITPNEYWQSIVSSADGSNLLAASSSYLFRSTNSGTTWEQLNPVLNTNAIISDLFVSTEISTNASNHKASTNVLSTTLANTNGVIGDTLNVATTLGIDVVGTNLLAGTNVVSINTEIGLTLTGTNVFDFGPVGTFLLGTNVGVIFASTNNTRTSANNLVISFANTPGTAYPIKPINTNFVDGLTLTLAGAKVLLTNKLGFSVVVSSVPEPWSAVASSADGVRLAAAVNGGYIYTSTDSGISWHTANVPNTNWIDLASSADGKTLVALSRGGLLYSSSDFGVTWAGTNLPPSIVNAGSVACSADGTELVAAVYQGAIYTSQTAAVPTPALNISAANGNIILTWPTGLANCTLQLKSSMSGNTDWADLPATPVVTNGLNQVTLPMTAGQSLYRLKRQ